MKYLPHKLNKDTGQHAIEYMTVIILIMAGIIIGGPYVIRSWNAQMKSWDDSVTDSLQDPLAEAPALSIQGCDPDPWDTVACGNVSQADPCTSTPISCGETEMLSSRLFDPVGCQCATIPPQATIECNANDCCCTTPVSTGYCGAQNTSLNLPRTTCSGTVPNASTITNESPLNGDGSCPDGYMKYRIYCGSDPNARYICVQDNACIFNCTGTLYSGAAYTGLCPNDNISLLGDTPYTYVSLCTLGQKCEIRCASTYIPNSSKTNCVCPTNYVVYNGICVYSASFTVASTINDNTNDQSTSLCRPQPPFGNITQTYVSGTGCGSSGTPGSSCAVYLW